MADDVVVNIDIPFPSNRLAQIAFDVLRIDKELKKTVSKELAVNNNILTGKFTGGVAKEVRVAVTSFFENINLILQTVEFAGDPVSHSFSHF